MLVSSPVENLRSALLYRSVNMSINCSPSSVVDQMGAMQSARHTANATNLSRKASYGSISASLCGRGGGFHLSAVNIIFK